VNRLSIVGLIALFATFCVNAEKIGIIDMNKVMTQSGQAAKLKSKLEDKYKPREEKLLALQKEIQQDMQKLQRDATVMTDKQKKSLQDKILTARKSFESKGRAFQQEVNKEQNDEMQKLFNNAKSTIDNIAKNEKFDVILQKEAVQYIAGNNDITDKVLAKLK
jgi:outer membrane protein